MLLTEDESRNSASSLSLFCFFIKELFHLNTQDRHQVTENNEKAELIIQHHQLFHMSKKLGWLS